MYIYVHPNVLKRCQKYQETAWKPAALPVNTTLETELHLLIASLHLHYLHCEFQVLRHFFFWRFTANKFLGQCSTVRWPSRIWLCLPQLPATIKKQKKRYALQESPADARVTRDSSVCIPPSWIFEIRKLHQYFGCPQKPHPRTK